MSAIQPFNEHSHLREELYEFILELPVYSLKLGLESLDNLVLKAAGFF